MEEKVHRSLFITPWKRLVGRPRHRWKILTLSYTRCDVAGGIDLAQGAYKHRMNIHAVCNDGKLLYLLGNCLLYKKAVLWVG
jgi:hypothetical protein